MGNPIDIIPFMYYNRSDRCKNTEDGADVISPDIIKTVVLALGYTGRCVVQ